MGRCVKLTWADLLVEDVSARDFERWIGEWSGFVSGRAAVAFLNKFGVWFLRRPEGPVDMLDVFSGDLERVADSFSEFQAKVNDPAWQEVYLLSKLVFSLHERGIVPGPGEAYAVAPHPAWGGPNPMAGEPVPVERIVVMAMSVWQSLCAQSLRRTEPDP